jgi:hypothetical protein
MEMNYLFFDSNFNDLLVDLHLPVGLQRVEVVVRHLVELGVCDVVQSLQDLTKAWTFLRIVAPTGFHLEK